MTVTAATRRAFVLDLSDPRHGTVNGYNNLLCRCVRCRAAWTSRHLERSRQRGVRLSADPALTPHGTESTYFNWRCRCGPCRDAHRIAGAARRARKSASAA